MKKIFCVFALTLLTCFCGTSNCFADDLDATSGGIENIMDATSVIENGFGNQKQITDEEFQKTIDKIKEKRMKSKKYRKKNNIPTPMKGSSINESNRESIDETAEQNLILTSPVEMITEDGMEIPAGHYKIVGKKAKDNSIRLEFYQSYTLVASVPALETKDDFDESSVNFIKMLPYSEQKVKIIYGSMDFNAYTFINIKQEFAD